MDPEIVSDTVVKAEPVEDKTSMQPLDLLKAALSQVSQALVKAEETNTLLQQHVTQVRDQRIAFTAQKQMLAELITKLENEK